MNDNKRYQSEEVDFNVMMAGNILGQELGGAPEIKIDPKVYNSKSRFQDVPAEKLKVVDDIFADTIMSKNADNSLAFPKEDKNEFNWDIGTTNNMMKEPSKFQIETGIGNNQQDNQFCLLDQSPMVPPTKLEFNFEDKQNEDRTTKIFNTISAKTNVNINLNPLFNSVVDMTGVNEGSGQGKLTLDAKTNSNPNLAILSKKNTIIVIQMLIKFNYHYI